MLGGAGLRWSGIAISNGRQRLIITAPSHRLVRSLDAIYSHTSIDTCSSLPTPVRWPVLHFVWRRIEQFHSIHHHGDRSNLPQLANSTPHRHVSRRHPQIHPHPPLSHLPHNLPTKNGRLPHPPPPQASKTSSKRSLAYQTSPKRSAT